MLSYNNDENLKDMLVSEMIKHKEQDQFIKGTYSKSGKDFRGCSVGCTIDSVNKILGKSYRTNSHKSLEESVGIPEWLARLQDTIFEGIPADEGADFSIDFLKAIPVGVNLEPVKWKFCSFVLKECLERVRVFGNISEEIEELREKILKAIISVLNLHEDAIATGIWDEDKAKVVAQEAQEAAESARAVAWAASLAAESAREASLTASLAAGSARAVAWVASWVAESAWAASLAAAEFSARTSAYKRYAAEIIRLLQS